MYSGARGIVVRSLTVLLFGGKVDVKFCTRSSSVGCPFRRKCNARFVLHHVGIGVLVVNAGLDPRHGIIMRRGAAVTEYDMPHRMDSYIGTLLNAECAPYLFGIEVTLTRGFDFVSV